MLLSFRLFGLVLRMKNIAFLCHNVDESGGLERVTTLIANELDKDVNYKIYIFSLYKNEKTFFSINSNINIVYINGLGYFSKIYQLRTILKKIKLDYLIVVDTLLSLIAIPSTLGLNIKCIGWEHYSYFSTLINIKRKLSRYLVAKFFTKIIILTDRDRYNWNKSFNISEKLYVVRNPSSFNINEYIDKTAFNNVLAVGRLRYEKGFDLLIKCWGLAKPHLPSNSKLIIVGDGEQKDSLNILINKLNLHDSVEIKGFTKNIDSYYRTAKIYCLTSRTEALPLVLIEALSFSTPLLAMDCYTGPREIIIDGYNGFLCEENNIELFSKKMIEVLNLDSWQFSNLCKNSYYSSKKYSIEETASVWKILLNNS